MLRALRVAAALAAGGVVLAISSSCIEHNEAPEDRNRPPETYITGAPQEGSDAGVSVHFFWRSYDSDGTVLAYVYAIDDTTFTNWRQTVKSDSVFVFRVLPDEPDVPHTFYVAAVDNDGKRDPTPDSRTFTAVDHNPPLVTSIWGTHSLSGGSPVVFAAGDTVPAPAPGQPAYDVHVHWTGEDADGTIVRYFWTLGDGPPTEIVYSDTTSAALGTVPPKDPEDRTRHILFVVAEDNAGLHGGAGAAGVEPAELPFTMDYTPHTIIDSLLAMGTKEGNSWDPVAYTHGAPTPPETTLYTAAEIGGKKAIIFPAESILKIHYTSSDLEDGCIKDIRWQAASGVMQSGATSSPFQPSNCAGSSSNGALITDKLTGTVPSASLKLWARGRDSWDRIEEPGPLVNFFVNFLPEVVIDSVRVDPVTLAATFRWHATDVDQDYGETRYQVSLDSGVRIEVGEGFDGATQTFTASYAAYDTTAGTKHTFVVQAANDLTQGRFSVADTTFTSPFRGACCRADTCSILTEEGCIAAGGTWQGAGVVCTPNPCSLPTGACCNLDGSCVELTQVDCGTAGGTWQGAGVLCTPNPCPPPTGACCYLNSSCAVLTLAACDSTSGSWQGAGTSCSPSPCP